MTQAIGTAQQESGFALSVKRVVLSALEDRSIAMTISIIGFILAWQVLAYVYPFGFPTPYGTAVYLYELVFLQTGLFLNSFLSSLIRVLIGFSVALFAATLIGVLMGYNQYIENYLFILVVITMMIPSLSWAMMTLILFGLNQTATVIAVILTTTPFLVVTIWEGVQDADKGLLEMAEIFNFTRYDTIREVILPQISPYVFSSGRYGLALAWKITVIVELLGSNSGIGYQLSRAFQIFSLEGVFAWTTVIIITMIVLEYGMLRPIENYVLDWRESEGV